MNLEDLRAPVADYLARCVRTKSGCLVNPNLEPGRYGEVRVGDRRMTAHRAVAALAAGRLPSPDEVARHACDNKPCAEASHLSLGTQSQNVTDIYDRDRREPGTWPKGEGRPHAFLTEEIVCEMRRLARAGLSLGAIVERFGLPYSPTRMAIRGETWAHIRSEPPVAGRRNKRPNPHAYRYTRRDEAAQVAELIRQGLSLSEVAVRLGISRHTAWRLGQLAKELAAVGAQ